MPRRNAVRSNASKSCSFFVLVGLMQSSLVYREKRLNKDLNDKYGMLFSRLNIPILSNRSLNAFRDIVLSFNNNFFPFPVLDIKYSTPL